ncbi:MAG: acyltransferase [Bacilli bacterium]
MSKKNTDRWYKLENTAKIFPPTSNKNDPKVFRFYVELKKEIDPIVLQFALDKTLEEFPLFKSVLKKGLFWYYLETTDIKPKVTIEETIPCEELNRGLLFRVNYFKKRLNIEVNHALTDGTGTLHFLKVLICNYETLKDNVSNEIYVDDISVLEREKDSYNKYFDRNKKEKNEKEKFAYQLNSKKYPEDRIKVIELIMSTNEVLKLSKEKKVTVTAYLTALMLKSIGDTMSHEEKKKEVVVTIPVNLRNYFPSNTARNFFNVIPIKYKFDEDNEDFETVLTETNKQFKEKITKAELEKRMNSLANFENIFIIRLIPIFIKDIFLKYIYKMTRKYRTITLSNIGIITIPEELEKYISHFGVFSSTDNIQSCLCTFKDKMVFTFTSHFLDCEIQKNFTRFLTEKGIQVLINTNIVEEEELDEKMF